MKCLNPYIVDSKKINGIHTEQRKYPVPCGKCVQCKKDRVKDWTFRLFYEERVAKSSYFVTLTYDTDNVPFSENGFMSLHKSRWHRKDGINDITKDKYGKPKLKTDQLQQFFQNLRNIDKSNYRSSIDYNPSIPLPAIRYYACGEYGETKERPHYHAIIFNVWDPTSIGKAWKKGTVHIEKDPKAGSFAYCAKYIDKGKRIPMFEKDDRVKEYSVMSNNIGLSYLTKEVLNWHRSDPINHNFVTYPGRKDKQRLPRYYYNKIYDKTTRKQLADYWEIEAIIERAKQEKLLQKKNMTIFEANDQKNRYAEIKFNKFTKKRDQWQNQNQ